MRLVGLGKTTFNDSHNSKYLSGPPSTIATMIEKYGQREFFISAPLNMNIVFRLAVPKLDCKISFRNWRLHLEVSKSKRES